MLNKKGSEFRMKKKRLRDRESKPNRKLRDRESKPNRKLRDRESKPNRKLRGRESRLNRKLRGKESRLNKKLRDREKKRSIRNWNLINTGTIQVLEKPIPSAEYSTEPISMKI
jgi:hypothetical protein